MPDVDRLRAWLSDAMRPERRVVYKRLSANDTGATGGHQVGIYVPNRFAFLVAPELDADVQNPRRTVRLDLESHGQRSDPSLIYYNNGRRGGTRNECRITGFGGRSSALQDPESTGAILLISFDAPGRTANGWLAATVREEDVVEAALGPIPPGVVGYLGPDETGTPALLEVAGTGSPCLADPTSLPPGWRAAFPSGRDLADEAARRARPVTADIDKMFMRRHDCEYALFRSVEAMHVLPTVQAGFATVDDFLGVAQTVLQRRKARAGRSLELQLARVFQDERVQFEAQVVTEPGHRPDFIFPSLGRYRAAPGGSPELAMLAAKSTLRDRWRQVLEEADKIPVKHLFTLDQGVSLSQFADITARDIVLVVPRVNLGRFPASVRPHLLTLSRFIGERRAAAV